VRVRASKPSLLKRDRERARGEKAARKREERVRRQAERGGEAGDRVATRSDLEGYGVAPVPGEVSGRDSRRT
jgi:hypothetical protein